MRSMITIIATTMLVSSATLAQDRPPTPPPVVDQPAAPASSVGFDDQGSVSVIETLPDAAPTAQGRALRAGMLEELRLVRERETAEVADLVAELQNSVSTDERLELQRQIGEVKADAIQESLTIQIEYAVLGGHDELAQRLEADLEQFEARRDAPRGTINTDTVRDRPVRGGESR